MTATYTASGSLTNPVNDLAAARRYLDEPMEQYLGFWDDDKPLARLVHTIRWDLVDESHWIVRVVTIRHLSDDESTRLSEWISGQNSDGLGEGFEQQEFAETSDYESDYSYDEDVRVSSFDWQSNDCALTLVRSTPDPDTTTSTPFEAIGKLVYDDARDEFRVSPPADVLLEQARRQDERIARRGGFGA